MRLRMGCNCFKASSQDDISLLRGIDGSSIDVSDFSAQSDFLPPPPYFNQNNDRRSVFLHPDINETFLPLSEEEQIKMAKRIGLINHLPCGTYDNKKKIRECAICMGDFVIGDKLRYLPCVHTFHRDCIDDWLMRSLTCPSCMEPVDAALLTTYDVNNY